MLRLTLSIITYFYRYWKTGLGFLGCKQIVQVILRCIGVIMWVYRSLHWLPVTFRIDFKVILLVYKSLNGLGPKYIADMLTEYKPNRPLRSVGSSQLETPRVHTKQRESAFSYFAACSWNQLPEEIRCAETLSTFKSRLKRLLFSCAYCWMSAVLCPNWLHYV